MYVNRLGRFTWTISFLAFSLLCTSSVLAQERGNEEPRVSPNATVSQTIGTTIVEIGYSRPQVKSRTIYGELVPYGEVWRTGANEATTFSVSSDVTIEGKSLPAGAYSLYTIPGQDTWTLIFNNVAQQWGTEYDSSEDAIRVEVTPESASSREMLTFLFEDVTNENATCVMHWAGVRVPFQIQVAGS